MKIKLYPVCFLLIILFVNLVFSKCLQGFYNISGKILNESKNPIANAKIFIFFDDSYDYYYAPLEEKELCMTNDAGLYSCRLAYGTLKYPTPFFIAIFTVHGDVCTKKPKKIEVIVYHEDYKVPRIIIKDFKKRIKGENISLEDIQLIKK